MRFPRSRVAAATLFTLALWNQSGTAQTPVELPAAGPAPVVPLNEPMLSEGIEPASGAVKLPGSAAPILGECSDCVSKSKFDWKNVPRVRAFPRPGNFPVPATGPGYYSALDQLRGECLKAPPKYPYPRFGLMQPSFFDMNFAYLDDPKNTEKDFFDPLKRVHIGENWLFSTGGDLRYRHESNYNNRLTQNDNNYDLTRMRIYTDLWYKDYFRVYAEFIGAWSANQDLAPLPIDRNHGDLLNLFVDVKVLELNDKPVYVRGGRQELLFGSQRLLSPLEWANTRRTFQGVRAMHSTEQWDFDAFWVNPVIPNVNEFDSIDSNQNIVGGWATYKPKKGHAIDAYYLVHDNTNRVTQQGVQRAPFTRYTLGSRYSGNEGNWLWDLEGAVQFGNAGGQDITAGMATAGLGYNFKNMPMNPTLWAYYDFASGGNTRGGNNHTFNQLFPFGHFYLGWIDQVGRQNIHDFNVQMYFYPTPWITTWVQFHSFWLANNQDALYNAAGNAIRRDATGRSGSHVGEELDLVMNFHLSNHSDFLMGYSYLFGGDFLRNTAGRNGAVDSSFLFFQMTYRW
ncbi:MAG: alginate export family protein [Fimbriiglobus sp.]